jgi:hypothetical protein
MTPREIIANVLPIENTSNTSIVGIHFIAQNAIEALHSAGYRIEPDWQPIETAPTDGTRFLAYDGGSHFDCWWHDYGYGEMGWRDEADSEPTPTHWRPLPAPPAIRALAKEKQG